MDACVLIMTGRVEENDWVMRRVATLHESPQLETMVLYSARQIVEHIEQIKDDRESTDDVRVVEAHMAPGEVYRAVEELKTAKSVSDVPVIVVSKAPEGRDRIARGYIFGAAPVAKGNVAMERFSKRIPAPPEPFS